MEPTDLEFTINGEPVSPCDISEVLVGATVRIEASGTPIYAELTRLPRSTVHSIVIGSGFHETWQAATVAVCADMRCAAMAYKALKASENAPVIETDGHAVTCLCGVSLHVPAKSRDMAKVEAEMRGWRCTRDNEMAIVWRCPSCATPSRDSTPDYYRIPRDAVQLWDVIATLGMTHCHAAALEYVYRAGRKPGASKADDLRKAVANLEYEIAMLESEGDET